jgi:hypothetical protein
MALDNRAERGWISALDKTREQTGVAIAFCRLGSRKPANVSRQRIELFRHGFTPGRR